MNYKLFVDKDFNFLNRKIKERIYSKLPIYLKYKYIRVIYNWFINNKSLILISMLLLIILILYSENIYKYYKILVAFIIFLLAYYFFNFQAKIFKEEPFLMDFISNENDLNGEIYPDDFVYTSTDPFYFKQRVKRNIKKKGKALLKTLNLKDFCY